MEVRFWISAQIAKCLNPEKNFPLIFAKFLFAAGKKVCFSNYIFDLD